MKMTLEDALMRAVQAHKAGKIAEADQLYGAILEVEPGHPDANHNLGLLAIGIGQIKEALPFLKKALEANPDIAQFWVSYINANLEVGDLATAKSSLALAKERSIDPETILRLEVKIADFSNATKSASVVKNPPSQKISELLKLYENTEFEKLLEIVDDLIIDFPNSIKLLSIKGAVHAGLTEYEAAINSYEKVLSLDSSDADALYNLANAYRNTSRLEEAIGFYRKALERKPSFSDGHNNLGISLLDSGQVENAIAVFKKVLTIDPNYAEAYNNLANAYLTIGEIDFAIENYLCAMRKNPLYAEAFVNLQGVLAQRILNDDGSQLLDEFRSGELEKILCEFPKYHVYRMINSFIKRDVARTREAVSTYVHLVNTKGLDSRNNNDRVFCEAYSKYIDELSSDEIKLPERQSATVYHIGESHCLSYAHHNIRLNGACYSVFPKIVFGAKAYHFSNSNRNKYKAIIERHLNSLPRGSIVFLSFGEIDCRGNEGLLVAAEKSNTDLRVLVDSTVSAYVRWFIEANSANQHQLYFFNISAPLFDSTLTFEENRKVALVVSLFNKELENVLQANEIKLIDVYSYTANESGFASGEYHIDNHHLDYRILGQIESQLN